jgi:segregation and condensation protein B
MSMQEEGQPELKARVEAVLFSSKSPLRLADIASVLNEDRVQVRTAMRSLLGDYRRRNTAIEILKSNGKYLLRLKPRYDETVRPIVPTELDRGAIKTMAYIAYYQPIRKSELVQKFGNKVYEDLKLLEGKDLVRTKGRTNARVLVTGSKFAEYFGLKSSRPEQVKAWIAEKLGVEPVKKAQETGSSTEPVQDAEPGDQTQAPEKDEP